MELWPIWVSLLKKYDNELMINQPFIKVAKSENEAVSMKKLIERKKNYLLEFINKEETERITEGLENCIVGGRVITYSCEITF